MNTPLPVCPLYFEKFIRKVISVPKNKRISLFGEHHVVDYFRRIEFQQRGSAHTHILFKELTDNMDESVKLVDSLLSLKNEVLDNPRTHYHAHTSACYKRGETRYMDSTHCSG